MIGIIDYGMGNLGSVLNAFRFLELDAKIVTTRQELDDCRALVLPGVGAFGDCMAHLVEHGFVGAIGQWIAAGKPFMGICLGLQALFESSEESPGIPGLGIFPGTVKRFMLPKELKVPQIGWNRMEQIRSECPMFQGIDNGTFFYLVHSYYVAPTDEAIVAGKTEYGIDYCSCIWEDNVYAVQFHPEKSGNEGQKIIDNFLFFTYSL